MMRITSWRRASWFAAIALLSACCVGVLGSVPHDAIGGLISSHGSEGGKLRAEDLSRLQHFLETKIVRQKLEDYGVPPNEALDKLREMSDQDLHVLASMADRIPEGGDDGETIVDLFLIMAVLSVVIMLILVILGVLGIGALAKYMKKSQTEKVGPPPEPAAEPAKR